MKNSDRKKEEAAAHVGFIPEPERVCTTRC
jgi:hypothetical protein